MELKTTEQLEEYLRSKKIPFDKATELSGGTANFIWRIEASGQPDTVIKHAEPYVKGAPALGFTQDRMDFEANVIRLLHSTALLKDPSTEKTVTLPTIYSYDHERHVIQANYAGPRNLKDAYVDPSLDVEACGQRMGIWLANLHSSTTKTEIGDHAAAKVMYRWSYQHLDRALERYEMDATLGTRINNNFGALLQTDDEVVCHGDCWSGNVIVSEDQNTLTMVDWEMTRRGCGATDVGQFAAEAFLLDHFRGSRGMMKSFLQAYRKHSEVTRRFAQRTAVHFATHLCVWPTQVPWGSREQTREVVQLGVKILSKAEEGDWEWLSDSIIGDIFSGIQGQSR